MKETWLAVGFVSVLSLFALFSIIKFATVVDEQDDSILSTPLEVEVVALPVLRLTDIGVWSNTNRSAAATSRYPYLTAIIAQSVTNNTEGWSFSCFGGIITIRWIVTAAHCKIPDYTYRALLYREYIQNLTSTHPIVRWTVHPGYISNSSVPWHDIALANVDKDLGPTPVFFTNTDQQVQPVQASIWKTIITMDRRTYLTNDMEIYDVELLNPVFCYERYGFTLDDTLICVNMTRDEDCFITEFGPIFTPTEPVLGVLRLMPNDCDNKVAVFTNVTPYFEWISKETGPGRESFRLNV